MAEAARVTLHPGDEPGDHARSAAPPSPLPPAPAPSAPTRLDTLPGLEAVARWPWAAPADNDFGPTATAWRAAKALSRTERHRADLGELREALDKLRETIDAGLAFLAGFTRLAKWAGGILGGAGLLGAAGALVRWLLTLHH
jgi:hypothetical protein